MSDPYWNNTSLLVHFDGTDGSTGFTDSTGNFPAFTITNGVYQTTANKKFGSSAAIFNGSNYLSIPSSPLFDYGSGPFTIEFWMYKTGAGGCRALMFGNNGSEQSLQMYIGSDGGGYFRPATGTNPTSGFGLPAGTFVLNQWMHVAMVWETASIQKVYIDGVIKGSATGYPWATGARQLSIGVDPTYTGGGYFVGLIDELRITKGVARYTADFTPPTAPFDDTIESADALPVYANETALLFRGTGVAGSTTFSDDASSNLLVPQGGVQVSTSFSKFSGSSAFFNGTNAYLSTPTVSPAFTTDGNPLTVEAWVYAVVAPNGSCVIGTVYDSTNVGFSLGFTRNSPDAGGGGPRPFFGFYAATWKAAVSPDALPLNQWVHLAGTYADGLFKIFVNGNIMGFAAGTIVARAMQGFIGRRWDAAATPYFSGYLQDVRVTKGVARYTNRFIPPTTTFPSLGVFKADDSPTYWPETTIKLDFNGTNNSTYIANERHGVTAVNDGAKLVTATKKFGTASAYFDGNTDFISAAGTAIGTLDFTAEAWIYPINGGHNGGNYSRLMLMGIDTSAGTLAWINTTTNPDQWFVQGHNGSSWINLIEPVGVTITNNAWHHMALVRKDGTFKMFIDGVPIASKTVAFDIQGTTTYFGANNYGSNGFYGHIDSIRITRGVARYLTRFVPPTKAFENLKVIDPYWGKVTLSLPLIDPAPLEYKAKTVTKGGTMAMSYTRYKFNNASYYSDGTAGNCLNIADSPDWALGSGDFTIEAWIYPTEITFYGRCIVNMGVSGGPSLNLSTYTGGELWLTASTDGSTWNVSTMTAASLTLNTWMHVAVTRTGGNIRLFVNGILKTTYAISGTVTAPIGGVQIGGARGGNAFKGYIQDVRITRGQARYTTNFAVPTDPNPRHDFTSTIGGIVKDHTGTPAARRVDIHSQTTGALLGSVWSDATTGAWSFPINEVCYAVAIDNDVTKRKAIIFDRIQPV